MGNESMGIGQSERPAITEETMKLQEYQKHLDGHLQSGAKMLMERLELQGKIDPELRGLRSRVKDFGLSHQHQTNDKKILIDTKGNEIRGPGSTNYNAGVKVNTDGKILDSEGQEVMTQQIPVVTGYNWNSFDIKSGFTYDGMFMRMNGEIFEIPMNAEKVILIQNLANSLLKYGADLYKGIGNTTTLPGLAKEAQPVRVINGTIVFKGTINDTNLYAGNQLTVEEKQKLANVVNRTLNRWNK